jgi:hypothetical protein
MKVFISWSGEKSHRVALAFHGWLPNVLQNIESYISSEDIEKGRRWSVEVGRALEDASYGIICVTRANQGSPWLNFEAGALSKIVDSTHVSPVLIDLRSADLVGPLSQFQATTLGFDDITRLARSIDSACEHQIGEARVADAVEVWWPNLARDMDAAVRQDPKSPEEPQREAPDMIMEVLEITRTIQRHLLSDELEAQNREDPRELARRHVRSALSQFHVSGAKLVDISPTAITVVFQEDPEPELISLIRSITNIHGMSLYTRVGYPNVAPQDDASRARTEDETGS